MTSQLKLSELWTYSESLESRVNSYCNFYTVLILAFGGLLLTKEREFYLEHGVIMLAAFVTFSIMNLFVMRAATLLLVGITDEIKNRVGSESFETREYPFRAASRLLWKRFSR